MKHRPISITIISWFLIITNVIAIASTFSMLGNPEVIKVMELSVIPVTWQYVLTATGIVVATFSAVLMLKASNIGRIMYVVWTTIALAIGLLTSPAVTMMVPGIVFFLICAFFLFRPKANEYFS